MPTIVRSQEEIDAVLNEVAEQGEKGGTKFAGETFESGLRSMYEWLVGDVDENPYE